MTSASEALRFPGLALRLREPSFLCLTLFAELDEEALEFGSVGGRLRRVGVG